jgi:RNA polymerase sigma-70 factor, ECF subfamily
MAHDPTIDDLALIQQITQGNQQALTELYARYARPVFNLALYVLQNRVLVFLLIWQSPQKWSPDKGQLSSWMMSVARHMAIDRLRHEKVRSSDHTESLDGLAEHLGVKTATVLAEDTALLRMLMQRLPKEQRDVLLLTYFRGLTAAEIAERLQIPVGTIKSRLRLSLDKLRDWWHEAVNERL